MNTSRISAPSSDAGPKSGPAPAMVRYRPLSFGRIRSRVSSQIVCGSPGFTDRLTSIMLRSGQIGSFTWMFSGKYGAVRRLHVQRRQIDRDAVEARPAG